MRLAALFLTLLVLGCKCPEKAVASTDKAVQDNPGLTALVTESYGGGEEEYLQVIRSEGELQKFFNGVNKTRKPGIPVPKVDFGRQQVVVYCAGVQQGTQVPELVPLQSNAEQLVLGVERNKSLRENPGTAVTTPFILYTMPITDKEVVLSKGKTP